MSRTDGQRSDSIIGRTVLQTVAANQKACVFVLLLLLYCEQIASNLRYFVISKYVSQLLPLLQ